MNGMHPALEELRSQFRAGSSSPEIPTTAKTVFYGGEERHPAAIGRSDRHATEEWPARMETSFGFAPAATHSATNV